MRVRLNDSKFFDKLALVNLYTFLVNPDPAV